MNVLILNIGHEPRELERYMRPDFPDVNFFSAGNEDEAENFIEIAEILVTFKISDSLLKRAKNLKWIHSAVTGTNYIEDLPSFKTRKDIILTSSRGIHGPQMSEMTIMLMIAMNRQFPRIIRNQEKRKWEQWPTTMLYKKKAGILGLGAIGESIAKKCKAFDMTVMGINPSYKKIEAVDEFYNLDGLYHVMSEADYFINVAPSKPDNLKILNAVAFSKMKPTSFFINIGRGETVDEDDLLKVLNERKIAGAALDTFWHEPLPPDHPFWSMDNIIITPHIGGMSDNYIQQISRIFYDNLMLFMNGERKNLINLVSRRKKIIK